MTQKSRQISHISLIAILLTLPLLFLYQNCGEISLQKIDSNSTNAEFGTPLRFDKIETANQHSCGVTSLGEVMCWGENDLGQLGDGSTRPSATPVLVEGISDVVQISLGHKHTCALIINGEVKCWGDNDNGKLGSGILPATLSFSSTPVAVLQSVGGVALAGVTQLSVGDYHSCVLFQNGNSKCWGQNEKGSLGIDPATTFSAIPVLVPGITNATQISLGNAHSCALSSSGEVKCWGSNGGGRLGRGIPSFGFPFSSTPEFVLQSVGGTTLVGVTEISLGNDYSCALMADEKVKCWGNNSYGQLGDNSSIGFSTIPVDVSILTDVMQISMGSHHSCAVLANKNTYCWGRGDYGQLGNSKTEQSLVPVQVPNLTNVARVSLGSFYSCALLAEGEVQCWGDNYFGQLGNGLLTSTSTPTVISGFSNITQLAFSALNSCVLLANKTMKCWGDNNSGQLGNDTFTSSIIPVSVVQAAGSASPLAAIESFLFGSSHVCALLSNKTVKCWGSNSAGQLGIGNNNIFSRIPVSVLNSAGSTNPLGNVEQVSLGDSHSCALVSGGSVKCWGLNNKGQIGDGSTTNKTSPVQVAGLTANVMQISMGSLHSCALMADAANPSDNIIKCWGRNDKGQLGDGTLTDRSTPIQVLGITNATQISMGQSHSCAVLTDKTVKCWGFNINGQLGNNDVAFSSSEPVVVKDATTGIALSDVVQIALGYSHSCAQLSTGEIKCWGSNRYGQLGVKGVVISNSARTSLLSYQGTLVSGAYSSAVVLNGQVKQVGRINAFVNIPVTLLELF